jgi:membrane protein
MTLGALQFLRTMIRTTNRIWQSPAYSWWRLPLKSLTLLGVAAGVVLVGILLPELVHRVQPSLVNWLPFLQWAFTLLADLIPWLALFGGLVVIYRLAPNRVTTFAEAWIGAAVATGLIAIGELLFQAYAVNLGHFSAYYGALGGIVAFLLWLYVASCACVFGICLCAGRAEGHGGAGR